MDVGAKAGLQVWRDRIGHKEAATITKHAANQGTAVHLLAEQYIKGEKLTGNPLELSRFRQLQPYIDNNIGEVWGLESQMYSHYLKLAGTTDVIGLYDGVPSVMDFKTSRKPKKLEWIKSYFMQTAGYAVMWNERINKPELLPKQLVILISVEHEAAQVFIQPIKPWVKELKNYLNEYHLPFSLNNKKQPES